ncbi:MAG: HEAT repeat domain-containing protein, partial [Planctomycetota bacterium]
ERFFLKILPLPKICYNEQSLMKALKDESWQVRRQAAFALGDLKSEAKEAISELTLLLEDEDINVRNAAESAIEEIENLK